jgi:hypothetical protein
MHSVRRAPAPGRQTCPPPPPSGARCQQCLPAHLQLEMQQEGRLRAHRHSLGLRGGRRHKQVPAVQLLVRGALAGGKRQLDAARAHTGTKRYLARRGGGEAGGGGRCVARAVQGRGCCGHRACMRLSCMRARACACMYVRARVVGVGRAVGQQRRAPSTPSPGRAGSLALLVRGPLGRIAGSVGATVPPPARTGTWSWSRSWAGRGCD